MKIIKSKAISPFGGINFVLEALNQQKIGKLLNKYLPKLAPQSKYTWQDIIYTYWSIIFCGGDCAEDIAFNLKDNFINNPYLKISSPDTILNRLKMLSEPSIFYKKNRSSVFNEFSINMKLNRINLKILKQLSLLQNKASVLDYDNTFVYTRKADAKRTYTKNNGYCPGVGIVGDTIVYVENRNGNCAPHTLQGETIERMFELLKSENIKIDSFRADAASYEFKTITTVDKYVSKLYIKASMNSAICEAIKSITNWQEINNNGRKILRGSTIFTPFKNTARKQKKQHLIKEYRLVVSKEKRIDGQVNLFTNEAYNYSPILTSDYEMSDDDIVFFYNARGKQEREFDVLKNDFIWNKLPFSKLEQNTVFFIITAICRNIYSYIIQAFSKRTKKLSNHYRLKKFIFRFICIPAKWVKSARTLKLRIYGPLSFKT